MKRTAFSVTALMLIICLILPVFGASYTIGDVNSDGGVNAKDALLIKTYVVHRENVYVRAGDLFFDGKLDVRDCFMLKAYFAGMADLQSLDRKAVLLTGEKYSGEFKNAVNELIIKEGNGGSDFDGHSFAVFEPDGKILSDTFKVYMTEHMAFPYTQREINNAAYEIMECFPEDSENYEICKALRSNISSSFKNLRSKYGPFSIEGVWGEKAESMKKDADYLKFAYSAAKISEIAEENGFVGIYFCTMSAENVSAAAKKCFEEYKGKTPETVTWTYGGDSVTLTAGGADVFLENELWDALTYSGIDVWTVSDTETVLLCSALDAFGLCGKIKGAVGDSAATENGKYKAFRESSAYPWRTDGDTLLCEYTSVPAIMTDEGKAGAVDSIARSYYGKGPSAVFSENENSALFTAFADTWLCAVLIGNDADEYRLAFPGEGRIKYPESERRKYIEFNEEETVSLSVMSLNIRCGNDEDGHSIFERRPRIKDTVSRVSPDVIGFQEVNEEWLSYLYEDYGGEYEIYNVWRDTAEKESAPILWRKDKFELLCRGAFWLSDTPDYMSDGYDPVHRICQYVKLKDKETGKCFVMMNTHVGFIEDNQKKSCDVIVEYAKKISDLPTFITGDFNLQPATKGYNTMTEYFTDVNMATSGDTGETFHGYYHGYEPTEQVDYCFADGKITPVFSEIMRETFDGKYASDHYALRFILEF